MMSPRQYLRSFRQPLTFAAFAADDPLPGLVELPLVAARMLTRSPAWRRRGAQRSAAAAARPAA
jgi:predicted ATP-grasp superfamily ATP-dependent carboligase